MHVGKRRAKWRHPLACLLRELRHVELVDDVETAGVHHVVDEALHDRVVSGGARGCELATLPAPRHTGLMTLWLATVGAFLLGVVMANAVSVRRHSPSHVVGQAALGGRGLFFSRTPDGTWWKLRLRPHRRGCRTAYPADWGDTAPPDGGVREPRPPSGPGPLSASVRLQPPAC